MKTWTIFTKEVQTKMEILLSSNVEFKTRSICREGKEGGCFNFGEIKLVTHEPCLIWQTIEQDHLLSHGWWLENSLN